MKQRLLNPQAARRVIAGLLLLFMALQVAQGQEADDNWSKHAAKMIVNSGKGLKDSPILIKTAEELAYLAQKTNTGDNLRVEDIRSTIYEVGNKNGFEGVYFALSNDIDLKGIDWTPIGIEGHPFSGNFDGKGHCVSGLTAITNDIEEAGLFGYTLNNTIQNLGVKVHEKGIKANGEDCFAGGIAGLAETTTTIRNCYVEGPGLVEAAGTGISTAGGIAGNAFDISHCYATVDVKASGGTRGCYAGGIVGQSNKIQLSCTYATGSVEAIGDNSYAGGICGQYAGTLSYNLALNKDIKGRNDYVHRIVGGDMRFGGGVLISNYASPDTYVNGEPVGSKEAKEDGSDDNIDLTNYAATLKTAPTSEDAPDVVNEWESGAWVFDDKGILLPQLRMVTGEDADKNPTYGDWNPNSPQPQLRAGNHMGVAKIENGGNGDSWAEAIQISNSAELKYLGKMVNTNGNLTVGSETIENNRTGFKGKYFILTDNIDLSAYHWEPIGTSMNYFRGHFDGKGHCISGLSVGYGSNQYAYAGLFGWVRNGTIQNLGVRLAENGGIWGSEYAGGIVGYIEASQSNTPAIRNCYVEGPGKVISTGDQNNNAGGIAGATVGANTTLSHCYATVDVEASGGNANNVGGIAGYGSGNISYTYATGSIQVSENGNNSVGGICGFVHVNTTLSNNLALNKEIKGGGSRIHRVAGHVPTNNSTLNNNYASPEINVNGIQTPLADLNKNGKQGDNTWLETYQEVLIVGTISAEQKQPWAFTTDGNLPQLNKVVVDGQGNLSYMPWGENALNATPQIAHNASLYLTSGPKLYIVAPKGGTLTVKAGEITQETGKRVLPGTTLTLSPQADNDHTFKTYLSGTDRESLANYGSNTIEMPNADLWLSATFEKKPEPEPDQETPDPPYVPIYYTVTIPSVEGATTDPGPGDYEVESWNTFRFYLTLDTAYSDSQPVVTTSRGETLTPRTSDGAYLVKYVRTDVEVFIDGILPNHPTANAAIEADALRIYALGSTLVIYAPRTAEAMLCDLSGRLLDTYQLAPGQTRIEGLRAGIYIVKVPGFEGVKVVIR